MPGLLDDSGELNTSQVSYALLLFGAIFFIWGMIEYSNGNHFILYFVLSIMCIPAGIFGFLKSRNEAGSSREYELLQE